MKSWVPFAMLGVLVLVFAAPELRAAEEKAPTAMKVVSVDAAKMTISVVEATAKDTTGAKTCMVNKKATITDATGAAIALDKIAAGSKVTMQCTCGKGCMDIIKVIADK